MRMQTQEEVNSITAARRDLKILDPVAMHRSVDRLYHQASARKEERLLKTALEVHEETAKSRRLTNTEEDEVTERLYYQNIARAEKRQLQLGKHYLKEDSGVKVLTRQEWSATVCRLHNTKTEEMSSSEGKIIKSVNHDVVVAM